MEIRTADPRSPEAAEMIRALSQELARRYDFMEDGSGNFKPEDVLVPGSAFLLGREDGQIVACGAFRPFGEDDAAEVKRMFVIPERRGRRYSRVMLAELERRAWECGYKKVRLETGDRQPEAIRLYQSAGYYRIPNFGIYAGNEQSLCFEKLLSTSGL